MAKRKSDAMNGIAGAPNTPESTNSSSIASKKSRKADPTPQSDILIDEANALNCEEFSDRYFDWRYATFGSDRQISCTLTFADDLTSRELDQCFNLIETTSRHDYEPSSFGWHPRRKRREMKEKEMRYLLVRSHTLDEGYQSPDEIPLEGFLSFMLTHDSSPVVPVLYIYEIHLSESARGKGLGLHLLRAAESFARNVGVEKVMLTCFLSNTNALSFYQRHGYRTDESSPGDRKTRNKVVKTDYVIMSKDVDVVDETPNNNGHVNGNSHSTKDQVMEQDHSASLITDRTDEIPSLDDCPGIMRTWTEALKQQELLDLGLSEAEKARHSLSSNDAEEASKHRDILSAIFQCLQTRYEAARDLDEILREQMYHLKSQISDVDRMAETLTKTMLQPPRIITPTPHDDNFDWDKATEQVYSAFYTLLRKAEEVDNRLDNIVEREQEADQREDDLDGREEELDTWETDIHEREKALAEREERLMRSKQRLQRLRRPGEPAASRLTGDQYQLPIAENEEQREGEQVRALPWRQESPPQNKVDSWLEQTGAYDWADPLG